MGSCEAEAWTTHTAESTFSSHSVCVYVSMHAYAVCSIEGSSSFAIPGATHAHARTQSSPTSKQKRACRPAANSGRKIKKEGLETTARNGTVESLLSSSSTVVLFHPFTPHGWVLYVCATSPSPAGKPIHLQWMWTALRCFCFECFLVCPC